MPEQFENPEATKLEDDTVSSESNQKAVERIAEEAAQKSSLREKKSDTDHKIFSILQAAKHSVEIVSQAKMERQSCRHEAA